MHFCTKTMGTRCACGRGADGHETERNKRETAVRCCCCSPAAHLYHQEHAASIIAESCEWNTYMCCWTGYDGEGDMVGSSDVCRVFDYPEEGDVLELPRDDEGPVYW